MTGHADDGRPVWAEIDLGAVTHNIDLIRQRAGRPVRVIVPVKANAYGHGSVAMGRHLERIGVDGLATANIDEAIELRTAGVRLPILMYASNLPAATSTLLAHGLTPTIADRAGLEAAVAAAGGEPVAVHVEVDAGFGRLGVRFDEAAAFVAAVVAERGVCLEGIYTHVPFSDDVGAAWARRRIAAFGELVRQIEATHGISIRYAQASASSAVIDGVPDDLNTVAPGHLTFGISPIAAVHAEYLGFRQALRAIRARVIHVGRREPGDDLAVGTPAGVARTAVLLLGIDNGYELSAGAAVLLHGSRCPVLSVNAEYVVVDISSLPGVVVGDVATIVGRDGADALDLHDVAARAGRSAGYWMMGFRRVPLQHDAAAPPP
ncbi:MAG: Alanine racemase [Ilumatobacteraceae bacterium]|nr:Alanine racemase [Ilumatobacteraceae bacterium]